MYLCDVFLDSAVGDLEYLSGEVNVTMDRESLFRFIHIDTNSPLWEEGRRKKGGRKKRERDREKERERGERRERERDVELNSHSGCMGKGSA